MYNSTNPDVSIVTVSWNVKDMLLECIKSIYEKTKNYSFEMIIVDNDSRDGTMDAVAEKYPEIKLIRNNFNGGIAVANNQGINASKGRFVCLLNPDTYLINNAIDILIKYLEDNSTVSAVGPKSNNPGEVIETNFYDRFPSLWTMFKDMSTLSARFPNSRIFGKYYFGNWNFDSERHVVHLATACMVLRREVIDNVGIMDEQFFMYSDDLDFCYRITKSGRKIMYFPDAEIFHHKGASSKQNHEIPLHVRQSFYKYFVKHYGVVYASCYKGLVGFIGLSFIMLYGLQLMTANKKRRLMIRQEIIPKLKEMVRWASEFSFVH